jgi:osmotically-inducible protein OsmY
MDPNQLIGGVVRITRDPETELFRPADSPKGSVDVTVVDGVVQLRGEAKNTTLLRALEERVRAIPEVRGVENLLHLPKTPAPTRTDTPARHRRRAARSGGPR